VASKTGVKSALTQENKNPAYRQEANPGYSK
jgi:hypothetical protein